MTGSVKWLYLNGHGPNANPGLQVLDVARYWSRDGQFEIYQIAEIEDGIYLFGESKWSSHSIVGTDVIWRIRSKIEMLPNSCWKENPPFAPVSRE